VRLGIAIIAAGGCAAVPTSPAPTPAVQPLVIGETFTIDARELGERRVINVYLPPDYAASGQRYPVLYMPDGGIKEDFPHVTGLIDVSIKNEVIRPFIVVGIENTERRRDLVGPTTVAKERAIAPHAGGSDRFRRFLRDELKPQIAARYRTTSEAALIGESLAGLFVVETLLVDPALFDAYIAVDPSVWWNDQAMVRGAAARFDAWPLPPKRLYVATGDLPEMQQGVAILLDAVRDHHPAGLDARYDPLPDEHHNTIFPVAALRGFRALFARAAAR
jgi:predicted alpha/beta superfamily hydrolase